MKRTGRAEYFARSSLYPWHRLLPLDNAVVLLLFILCLLLHHLCVCVCVCVCLCVCVCVCVWRGVWSLFCCVILSVLSRFVIMSLGKRQLVAYFQMPSRCHVYSCQCYVYLSHVAVIWSTLCACGIRGSRGGRGSGPPEIVFF